MEKKILKIKESDLKKIVIESSKVVLNRFFNEENFANEVNYLFESSWSRVLSWMDSHDIATITAFRHKLVNVTEKTEIPEGMQVGNAFSLKQNRLRNRDLKATLLSWGYGVTNIHGSWIEGIGGNDSKEVAEESFFVVNLKDDPNFYNNLFKVSEFYNQDSFLYKPKNSDMAMIVGTNSSEYPGYGNAVTAGNLTSLPSKFMSRIKNAAFAFVDKSNWVVKDKKQDLTNADMEDYTKSYSWKNDDRPTFSKRKEERIEKSNQMREDWIKIKENGGIILEEMSSFTPKQRNVIGMIAKNVLKSL